MKKVFAAAIFVLALSGAANTASAADFSFGVGVSSGHRYRSYPRYRGYYNSYPRYYYSSPYYTNYYYSDPYYYGSYYPRSRYYYPRHRYSRHW